MYAIYITDDTGTGDSEEWLLGLVGTEDEAHGVVHKLESIAADWYAEIYNAAASSGNRYAAVEISERYRDKVFEYLGSIGFLPELADLPGRFRVNLCWSMEARAVQTQTLKP